MSSHCSRARAQLSPKLCAIDDDTSRKKSRTEVESWGKDSATIVNEKRDDIFGRFDECDGKTYGRKLILTFL